MAPEAVTERLLLRSELLDLTQQRRFDLSVGAAVDELQDSGEPWPVGATLLEEALYPSHGRIRDVSDLVRLEALQFGWQTGIDDAPLFDQSEARGAQSCGFRLSIHGGAGNGVIVLSRRLMRFRLKPCIHGLQAE